MSKFVESAKKTLGGHPIFEGRELIKSEEVIRKYPEGVKIDEFDVLNKDGKDYVVFHIEGTKTIFASGSMALKIVNEWLKLFNGDLIACNEELKTDPVTFKLTKGKTEKGHDIIRFDVIE